MALGVHRAQKLVTRMVDLSNSFKNAEIEEARSGQFREISAKVAHEIRNPMSAIHVSSHVILKKSKAASLDIDKPINRIRNSVQRCEQVINDLMEFASDLGEIRVHVRIDDWLENLLNIEINKLPKSVNLEFHPGVGDLQLAMDANLMASAICRLLANAADAITGQSDSSKSGAVPANRQYYSFFTAG